MTNHQLSSAQLSSAQLSSAQLSSAQLGSARLGSARLGMTRHQQHGFTSVEIGGGSGHHWAAPGRGAEGAGTDCFSTCQQFDLKYEWLQGSHLCNEVERVFRRLRAWRRVFAGYHKTDVMFAAFITASLIAEALRLR